MARRQLVTIGDLRAQPLTRTRQRRQAMGLGWYDMGSATSSTAGAPLMAASAALLAQTDAQGAPPETTDDPLTRAFQEAWNADPTNADDQLTVDGEYGPLTFGAQNTITGGVATPVNGGASPATPTAPGTTPATVGGESALFWLLLAAAGVGAYFLMRKKGGGRRRARRSGSTVEIHTNPSRRRRRNDELIPS